MKKILIISPHFPPSNLTAVHRARFFANHLSGLGWEPIILTVHEAYYEEELDYNLQKLVPDSLRIEKVKAIGVSRPRLIGDIGLRAFRSMYRKAKDIITKEKVDFLYITIPSFYGALWGRWLHETTGIPYGIDYIDPWVHVFPGSEKKFSRHYMATLVSKFLEPIAVKKASLISGVAASYYQDVIERNPHLKDNCELVAIPFGSEKKDHEAVQAFDLQPYLFEPKSHKFRFVYAGAMLPKAYEPLEAVLQSISQNPAQFSDVEIYFIGTGSALKNARSYRIKSLAEKYGLWEKVIFEYPVRIPYLDVLTHLNAVDGVFILGSTEPHYTPSKVYQGVLSQKPILAVLHNKSTAVTVIRDSKAGIVLDFDGEKELDKIENRFSKVFASYREFARQYNFAEVDQSSFVEYSAERVTEMLVSKIEAAIHAKSIY